MGRIKSEERSPSLGNMSPGDDFDDIDLLGQAVKSEQKRISPPTTTPLKNATPKGSAKKARSQAANTPRSAHPDEPARKPTAPSSLRKGRGSANTKESTTLQAQPGQSASEDEPRNSARRPQAGSKKRESPASASNKVANKRPRLSEDRSARGTGFGTLAAQSNVEEDAASPSSARGAHTASSPRRNSSRSNLKDVHTPTDEPKGKRSQKGKQPQFRRTELNHALVDDDGAAEASMANNIDSDEASSETGEDPDLPIESAEKSAINIPSPAQLSRIFPTPASLPPHPPTPTSSVDRCPSVCHFLSSLPLPLTHLYPIFANLGCTTSGDLLALSDVSDVGARGRDVFLNVLAQESEKTEALTTWQRVVLEAGLRDVNQRWGKLMATT